MFLHTFKFIYSLFPYIPSRFYRIFRIYLKYDLLMNGVTCIKLIGRDNENLIKGRVSLKVKHFCLCTKWAIKFLLRVELEVRLLIESNAVEFFIING